MRSATVGGDVGGDPAIDLSFERCAITGDAAIDPFEMRIADRVIGIAQDDEAAGETRGRDARGGDPAHRFGQIGGTADDEVRYRIERGQTVSQQSFDLAGRLGSNETRGELLADRPARSAASVNV